MDTVVNSYKYKQELLLDSVRDYKTVQTSLQHKQNWTTHHLKTAGQTYRQVMKATRTEMLTLQQYLFLTGTLSSFII